MENWGVYRPRGPGPGTLNPNDDITWDIGTSCSINKNTPWNIIRCALLWFISCQHCQHDLNDGVFHIGVALYKSWHCTVQVGMAVWRQLQKFRKKRDPSKHADMETAFLSIWCQSNLFCSTPGVSLDRTQRRIETTYRVILRIFSLLTGLSGVIQAVPMRFLFPQKNSLLRRLHPFMVLVPRVLTWKQRTWRRISLDY